MTANDTRDNLRNITSRLERARKTVQDPLREPSTGKSETSSVLSLAFRVAVEIVSAVAIGFGIGWCLDDWVGTKPWLMVVFVMIGFAAGMLNIYRMASGFGYAAGYTTGKHKTGANPGPDEET